MLRAHPNATFWATDHLWQASLNASDPAATPPCRQCSYGCKRCLRLPAESAHVPLSVGLLGRRMDSHEYLDNMRNATFCLVPRGDNEMTRKFTEAIVAGAVGAVLRHRRGLSLRDRDIAWRPSGNARIPACLWLA